MQFVQILRGSGGGEGAAGEAGVDAASSLLTSVHLAEPAAHGGRGCWLLSVLESYKPAMCGPPLSTPAL